MNFELTDILTCPACGPDHGLILLVESVHDRRVSEGWLGCSNCQTDYRVEGGVADLRSREARDADAAKVAPFRQDELPVKVAALSGIREGPAQILIGPRLVEVADALADLLPDVEVVAVSRTPLASAEDERVSYVICDVGLPLARYRLPAVALVASGDPGAVAAGASLIRAGGRLVLFDAGDGDVAAIRDEGLAIVARQGGTVVAERSA